jgi:hypothetical protein
MGFFDLFRAYRTTAFDPAVWHQCRNPIIPRRTFDGKWTNLVGQTWRRQRKDGKWEYKQDAETGDEWFRRQF